MAAINPRVPVGCALACLVVLFPVAYSGLQRYRAVQDAQRFGFELQHLAALGYRRSSELMKSRAGIVGHYDALVQTEAAVQATLVRLEGLEKLLAKEQQDAMARQLAEVRQDARRASELLERFKRNQSILRNSLRYLPVLGNELETSGRRGTPLGHAADELIHDTLLMESWPDPELAQRVETRLAGMMEEAALIDVGSPLHLALLHLQKAAQVAPNVRYITKEILDLRGGPQSSDYAERFMRLSARMNAGYDQVRLTGFLLALASLLFSAAAVVGRVSRSEAAERRVSAELGHALSSLRMEQSRQAELAELKSKFVSMASHEFRTPLSVILSSSDMLEAYDSKWPPERKAEHFDRIRTAARGMTELLDDILMVGRSDAGMLRCNRERTNIEQLCREVVEELAASFAADRRIVVRGLDTELYAMVDEGLLRRALGNVLSNALKYSGAAEPVRLDVATQEGQLVFRVRDEGIGIADTDRERLFETFHRGANVGRVAGSGLGLAIVKRAVELHGGHVLVESQLGSGSTFVLEIPLEEPLS